MDKVVLTTSHAINLTPEGPWQIPTSTSQGSRYLHNDVYHRSVRYNPNKRDSHDIAENNKKNNGFRERHLTFGGMIFSVAKVYL